MTLDYKFEKWARAASDDELKDRASQLRYIKDRTVRKLADCEDEWTALDLSKELVRVNMQLTFIEKRLAHF